MKDVKYDNFGGGWEWHGTNGAVRKPYKSARNVAIRQYGKLNVTTVERLCRKEVDIYLLSVVLNQAGLGKLIGVGISSCPLGPIHETLVKSPKLESARFKAYQAACDKLGITKYPNRPPNWELVIRAAENIGDSRKKLEKIGQFGGTKGSLKNEEASHYTTCYYKLVVE